MLLPKNPSSMNVLSSDFPEKKPVNATCARPFVNSTSRLPVLAGRRNGAAPTSGPNAPIETPGNAGLIAGDRSPLANDFVTTACRWVYEPEILTCAPTDNS